MMMLQARKIFRSVLIGMAFTSLIVAPACRPSELSFDLGEAPTDHAAAPQPASDTQSAADQNQPADLAPSDPDTCSVPGSAAATQEASSPLVPACVAPEGQEDSLSQPVTSNNSTSSQLAAGIQQVEPANGSRVCLLPRIAADLLLDDTMRQEGALDLSKVKFTIDGVDLTQQLQVLGTMDFPQSRASLSYVPNDPISLGRHRATLTLDQTVFEWEFETADTACP